MEWLVRQSPRRENGRMNAHRREMVKKGRCTVWSKEMLGKWFRSTPNREPKKERRRSKSRSIPFHILCASFLLLPPLNISFCLRRFGWKTLNGGKCEQKGNCSIRLARTHSQNVEALLQKSPFCKFFVVALQGFENLMIFRGFEGDFGRGDYEGFLKAFEGVL